VVQWRVVFHPDSFSSCVVKLRLRRASHRILLAAGFAPHTPSI
jgi:hypothetical protein